MEFIRGIELSRRYWSEVVAPIIDDLLPGEPRSAALVGNGSEVLGFDTERSTDHGWGPRVVVFIGDHLDSGAGNRRALAKTIDARIPDEFLGYKTRFAAVTGGPVTHQVSLTTIKAWFLATLGFDPRNEVDAAAWLAAPWQLLRESTAGAVFEDESGELVRAREQLRWYPDDVWLYVLGCQWRRIDQEEPFVGRAGEVADELGSAVVAARLARDLMRLCFLIERQYAPYSKWLGTAFAQLACAEAMTPLLKEALGARSWKEREAALVPAFEYVAGAFNDLGLTPPQDPTVQYFYDRPFRVLNSGRFVEACMACTPLSPLGYRGSIDQFVDSTDVLSSADPTERLAMFNTPGNARKPIPDRRR